MDNLSTSTGTHKVAPVGWHHTLKSWLQVVEQRTRRLTHHAASLYLSPIFSWALLSIGVLLRLIQYGFDRAMWIDELSLTQNLVERSFAGLLQPLTNDQGAPLGFLVVEKLFITLLGTQEYTLRLFPFLCGIAALLLFYFLAKRCLHPYAVPVALALFAASNPLMYYAAMVKQYSTDVLVTVALLLLGVHYLSRKLSSKDMLIMGAAGSVAVWFSHPAIFVLAGIGISLFLNRVVHGDRESRRRLAVVGALWLASFAVTYVVSLQYLVVNQYLLAYWDNAYFPLLPDSLPDFMWIGNTILAMFRDMLQFKMVSSVAMLAALTGAMALFQRTWALVPLLLLPIFFTALASGLGKYPFSGRLILFLIPPVLLLVSEGVEDIVRKLGRNYLLFRVTVMGFILIPVVLQVNPHQYKEEIRPVLSYLHQHLQSGDLLYIQQGANSSFRYYGERFGFDVEADYVVWGITSKEQPEKYKADLDKLRGKTRVWILFSHITGDEDLFILNYLDAIGTRLDGYVYAASNGTPDAQVYLYDLSRPVADTSP